MGCCFSSPVRNHSPVYSNGIQDKPSTLPVNGDHHPIGPPPGELRSSTRAVEVPAGELRSSTRPADSPAAELRSSAGPANVPAANVETPANLKVYTMEELRIATRNFRPDSVVGEGGFGKVFKGWIDEKTLAPAKVHVGIPVAVKKSNPNSEQGLREWRAEVEFLGKFRHPNLVKLVGYCWEENQFLLVYEYMHKGSLEAHLFSNKEAHLLSWEMRLKIAISAAKGLAFLHNTEKKVIYRDFKASNILLDSDFGAKLSDFGLATHGPINGKSHVSTRIVGTYGYAAPEYVATGHLYIKSDVYCFGVVVLELLTGQRVVDVKRPARQSNLVEWAKPILQDKKKLKRIVDPRLERQFPVKAVLQTAELISSCLENDPKNRPSMADVLEILENIIAIKMSPRETKHHQKDQPDTDNSLHQ